MIATAILVTESTRWETAIVQIIEGTKTKKCYYFRRQIKHVNVYEITGKLNKCKKFVKSFSGAKVRCLKDHMKPSLRENPDHFVLYIGTNNPNSDRSPELTAKSITDVGSSLKNN